MIKQKLKYTYIIFNQVMMFGWVIQEEIPIQEITPHLILAPLVMIFGLLDFVNDFI